MAQNHSATQRVFYWGAGFMLAAIVSAVILDWLYPLSTERELARWPMAVLLTVYALTIVLLSTCVVGISLVFSIRFHGRSASGAFFASSTVFLILMLYCIVVVKTFPAGFGVELVDIMNAKLLAEWQFIKFVTVIAPLCAVLTATLTWFALRHFHSDARS
jgi:hypothetical protein